MSQLSKYADENKLPVMDQQTFETVTNDIGKEKFREDLAQMCEDMMGGIGEAVGLHIRRKDYLTNSNHCALDLEYYKKALQKFPEQLEFRGRSLDLFLVLLLLHLWVVHCIPKLTTLVIIYPLFVLLFLLFWKYSW
mgnify:CR=1 FL=1